MILLNKRLRSFLFLIGIIIGFPLLLEAQVTGTVFQDYNANGIMDGSDFGIDQVMVTGYGANGTTYGPVVTDFLGTYTLPGVNQATRIEFTWDFDWLKSGPSGGTSVQFVSGATTGVNFSVLNPNDFCQPDPRMATPCYVAGDPLPTGSESATGSWFVLFDYNNESYPGQANYTAPQASSTGEIIGTTWGAAYHKEEDKLLAGAFLKRHVGFGQNGTGAIYQIDPSDGSASLWVDLNSYPNVDTGVDPRDGSYDNSLNSDPAQPSVDLIAFSEVGKISLGDIDLSEDQSRLYAISLNDKKLVEIPITPGFMPGSAVNTYDIGNALVNLFSGPDACSNLEDYRPFGLKIHRGKAYIGAVCSGQSSGDASELQAYVISLNLSNTGAGFQTELTFPLDYARDWLQGCNAPGAGGFEYSVADWLPWEDNWNNAYSGGNLGQHPSPILSDISFDNDGSMVLGFIDRFGHQTGVDNYGATSGNSTIDEILPTTAGDLLRVCNNMGTWELEGTGSCPTNGTGAPFYTVEEFYYDEWFSFSSTGTPCQHGEVSVGGVALNKGTNSLMQTVFDPFRFNSGGIHWYNSQNGSKIKGYELYESDRNGTPDNGGWGKAHGLGDLEMLCNSAPIEIGNFVWLDTDADGIQDANESGIEGVELQLYDPASMSVIATAISDAGGMYIFSSGSGTTNSSFVYDLSLDFGGNYEIRILGAEGNVQQSPLDGLQNTVANNDNSSNGDARDSDGSDSDTSVIQITMGSAGENNHSYDFGFVSNPCTDPNCFTISVQGSN